MVSVAFEAATVVSKSDLQQPLRLILYFQLSLRKEQRAGTLRQKSQVSCFYYYFSCPCTQLPPDLMHIFEITVMYVLRNVLHGLVSNSVLSVADLVNINRFCNSYNDKESA